ncbi:MAG: hypothetical protein JNM17_29600 [Archangium sp.]|nr:hypothetical protein [Archangium sp.]
MRLVLLASAVVLMACPLPDRALDAGQPSRCIVLPDQFDLGVGELDTPVEKTLPLFNDTGRAVTFTSTIDPPFSTLFPQVVMVAANQSIPIRIRFTPTDGRLHLGRFSYVGGSGCPTREVLLQGLGAGRVETDTPVLDFGRVPFGTSKTIPIVLRSSRRSQMTLRFDAASQYQFDRQVVMPASNSLNIPVTITAQVGEPIAGAITVFAMGGDTERDEIRVEVRGEPGTPIVVVEPLHFSIERVPLGGPLERRITVRNDSQATATVELLELSDAGTVLSGFMPGAGMAPSSSMTVPIQVQARTVGPATGRLLVKSDDPQHPEQLVTIDFTGEALFQCAVTINADPVSVLSPTAMYPARLTFTFTNPTANDCLLDDIHPTNDTWSLDTGQTEQLIVPALGSATRTVVVPAPGNGFLEWTTFKVVSVRQTAHIHLGP